MNGGQKNHDAELKHIEEVSRNARTTWFGMLGVLVFGAIAVAGVKDRDFFTYGVETALPLVGVTVPTLAFFVAAPILILAIYIYLHLYLLKLWRGLGTLPAHVHVDGSIESVPLDDAVYPWLLSDAAIHWKPGARRRTLGWLTWLVSLALGWMGFMAACIVVAFRFEPEAYISVGPRLIVRQILMVATIMGAPREGFIAVAVWTVLCLLIHLWRIGQALVARRTGPLGSWLAEA